MRIGISDHYTICFINNPIAVLILVNKGTQTCLLSRGLRVIVNLLIRFKKACNLKAVPSTDRRTFLNNITTEITALDIRAGVDQVNNLVPVVGKIKINTLADLTDVILPTNSYFPTFVFDDARVLEGGIKTDHIGNRKRQENVFGAPLVQVTRHAQAIIQE